VQDAVIKNHVGIGVGMERHLSCTDNVIFAALGSDTFDPMVEKVIAGEEKVDAVTTFHTNLSTAGLVKGWEEIFGVPVLDSASTVVWNCLKMGDVDAAQVKGWGSLMQL
jgi:maleate isomerase